MAQYTVREGVRYRATVSLDWLEALADNETVAAKFREVGFDEVTVEGEGDERVVEGTWPFKNASADIPSQVTHIEEA